MLLCGLSCHEFYFISCYCVGLGLSCHVMLLLLFSVIILYYIIIIIIMLLLLFSIFILYYIIIIIIHFIHNNCFIMDIYCFIDFLYRDILYKIAEKNFLLTIGIINNNQPLKSKCLKGYNLNESCEWIQNKSQINLIYGMTHFWLLLQPIIKCKKHKQECKIYLYRNDKERVYHGDGDFIINPQKFWTIASSDSKVVNRGSINSRFHITEKALHCLWTERLTNHSTNEISKSFIKKYSIELKHILCNKYGNDIYIDKLESFIEECMWNPKHLKLLSRQLLRGYLSPKLKEWQIAYHEFPTQEISQDATPSISDKLLIKGTGQSSLVFVFVSVSVSV